MDTAEEVVKEIERLPAPNETTGNSESVSPGKSHSAHLVEQMITQRPWCNHPWARCALATAARTIRRGRHLTEPEKIENLAASMDDGAPDGIRIANSLRAIMRSSHDET